MKKMLPVALLPVSLLLASCEREPSSSVDQDKIWTRYEIKYDKNTDKTTAYAEFRFGNALGTKLELSDPALVTFNGTTMPFNAVTANYELELGGMVPAGTFVYTDLDNNVFANSTDSLQSVEFPSAAITIDSGSDYVLNFVGEPIGSNDLVNVVIADKSFTTAVEGATSITLGGVQTGEITNGPHIAYMWRSLVRNVGQGTSEGGTIFLTYQAFNKAVNVE